MTWLSIKSSQLRKVRSFSIPVAAVFGILVLATAPRNAAGQNAPPAGPLTTRWASVETLPTLPAPQSEPASTRSWGNTLLAGVAGSVIGQAVGLRLGYLVFGLSSGSYDAAIIGGVATGSFVGALSAGGISSWGLGLSGDARGGVAMGSMLLGAGLGLVGYQAGDVFGWFVGNTAGHALGATAVLHRSGPPEK